MKKDNSTKQLKKQYASLPSGMRYKRFVLAKDYIVFKLVKKNAESEKIMKKFERLHLQEKHKGGNYGC